MNEKRFKEVVSRVAKTVVGEGRNIAPEILDRRERFLKVVDGISSLRGRYNANSEEAIFLAIVRDMAVHISRSNPDMVQGLAREISLTFGR